MDFLTCREKDQLYAKYSTFPGWHSSNTYEHKPSTTTCLQHLSEYKGSSGDPKTWVASGPRTTRDIYDFNKQTEIPSISNFHSHTKLSHAELSDYIGEVRNRVPIEKQRPDKGRYAERDQGWENTWPINYKQIRENFGANSHKEMQAYADCYPHTRSKKTPCFEDGEWRSSRCASDMGSGQWAVSPDVTEQFQPVSQQKNNTKLMGEQWWAWSPRNSRNTESVFPVESFRQPPSYMAPPEYSSPKRAGIPKITAGAFQEQTFESKKVPFTDLMETRCDPTSNNGQYLQNINQTQNTERYHCDITDGQRCLEALNTSNVMQYTTIHTKPQLQYRESPQMTPPDITRTKQTKLPRRKGGETVFCLVSRMGEVSGLSSSPEEPLKSHVLPLLTSCKPDYETITTEQTNSPQLKDDSRQNQDAFSKQDKAVGQLDRSLMLGEYGHAPLDQRSTSVRDRGHAIALDQNKEELQSYVQDIDSESNGLAQKTDKESIEKFPLWKEPKYQHPLTNMTEQTSQGINDKPEVSDLSTNEQEQSLVLIDASCVVVKVELVLLPEKEHVQYVCLTEESPLTSAREEIGEQKQHSSAVSSQETPENNTLDERVDGALGITHELPRTLGSVSEELDSSCERHIVGPVKEIEESSSPAATVDERDGKLVPGHSQRETTLESNDGLEEMLNIMKVEDQTASQEPEAVFEDLHFANAKPTSQILPEKTTIYLNQEQGHGPAFDDSVVEHSTQKDNENQTDAKDPTKDGLTEDSFSDDEQELISDCSTSVLWKSAKHFAFELSDISASHTENEPPLPPSFTNSEILQCSGPPSVQSSSLPSLSSTPLPEAFEDSSLLQTGNIPSDVSLCTSSPREQKQKIQHAESLWDAVCRIRRHTAPDSETEDEEQSEGTDTDLIYQRLITEEEGESEDNTLGN